MDFQQAEEKFRVLKARFKAGEIDEAEYKARLEDLMVEDAQGDWWMIGYNSEHWHRHDGTDWVRDDPPGYTVSTQEAATGVKRIPRPAEPVLPKPTPAKRNIPRLWLGVAAAGIVGLIALCALTIKYYPGGLIVWKTPSSPLPTATDSPAAQIPSSAPGVTANGESKLLFQDDFSDPNSKWTTTADANSSALIVNGALVVQAFTGHYPVLAYPGLNIGDVSLEMDASQYGGSDNTYFGFLCRFQDMDNYYYLIITSGGYTEIGKKQSGTIYSLTARYIPPGILLNGDSINHLQGECEGSTLTASLNGTSIVSITDTSFPSGDVGLYVFSGDESSGEISFDNFVVRVPDASGQAAPTPNADASILFQDDFSNTSSGWLSIDDPTRIAGYTGGGRYQILNFADHQDTWSHPGLDLSDVSIEVDATKESGQDDNDFGVICRYQDDQNFYFFVISSDGRQLIGKFQNNEFVELSAADMQPTDAIAQGNSTNHLRADCTGSTLTFYINGERVAAVTDDTFTSGDVGLMAGTNSAPTVEIAFDNFVVRKADASAQATPAADASILFQDDFSDPNSGWFLVTDWGGSATATYTSSGQYRLDAKVPHVEVLARPGKRFTDTRMEVDVTVDWAHEGKYGLICRYQDEFNFYIFMVDNNWFFIGRRDGNSNKVLVDWTRTSVIVSYIDGTYHLRADCSGSSLTLYINGEKQASVTDDSLRDGDVGLLLLAPDEPNAERIFDNFVVRKP